MSALRCTHTYMRTVHISTLTCTITGDHPPKQTKTQAVSFFSSSLPFPSPPTPLPPTVTSGTLVVPNTLLQPSRPHRCHLAADTPLHFSIHLSVSRGTLRRDSTWRRASVCVFVCVWQQQEEGGKGGRQVNELVIRIDVASACGFPPKLFSSACSFSGHLCTFWTLCHHLCPLLLGSPCPHCLSFAQHLYLPHFGPRLRNLLLPLSSITPSPFVLATSLLLFYASLSSSPLFFHLVPVTPIFLSPPDVPLITADHLTGS